MLPTGNFLDLVNAQGSDLWGPFWIPTTVACLCFVSSSLSAALSAYQTGQEYTYDYSLLSTAFTLIYAYTWAVPIGLWGLLKYIGFQISWLESVSIYGYSMTVWLVIPVKFPFTHLSIDYMYSSMG